MAKNICILHANCQGEAIKPLLEASPAFSRLFEIRQYLNYTREDVAARDLENCVLLLHQHLAPKWGPLSSAEMLSRLPSDSSHICLPNFFFKGYWPFWTSHTNVIDFADSMVEDLLQKGLSASEIMHVYLRGGPAMFGDLEKAAAESLATEREKEKLTPIKYTNIIEEKWRSEQLFLTINHPVKFLLFYEANSILKLLELPTLPDSLLDAWPQPHGNFELPIHPWVAGALRLPFAPPDRKYKCFGHELTFREYLSRYLACREAGISDLGSVLQNFDDTGVNAEKHRH